eukprot:CAMPEP_0197294092 /NCGR_PEP_ID=MMETSP0890-20130614/31006_1 /TAXON_ID=44058 ORGANISM="Aureoumbra lagunensis, Strain CCMP1510" /NCGR_SAMPLE_ID=MMETSP0890 /ASSEMBLY_ACC=CAM_ASM_000533 /LENGTH=394 /DNA_ID=CAMNT_0042769259 /DNA_START=31 /DNA_END=1215 /DNA_ORIENTATION=-
MNPQVITDAERELVEIRNAVSHLSANGIVRQRLEVALSCVETELNSAKMETNDFVVIDHGKAGKEPVTTATVAEGIEFCEAARLSREKLEKALSYGESNRPVDEKEALALCIHTLLTCRVEGYPGLLCIGIPTKSSPAIAGFAPPVRELQRGKLLPSDWQNIEPGICGFKYRRDGYQNPQAAEVFEMRCFISQSGYLHIVLTSATRGLLHEDNIFIGFSGDVVPAARFEYVAEYVRDVISPRLDPPGSNQSPQLSSTIVADTRQQNQRNNTLIPNTIDQERSRENFSIKCGRPEFSLPHPPQRIGGAPFFMDPDEHMLVGPGHPDFTGGSTRSAVPRYDPMTPDDIPSLPFSPGGPLPPRGAGRFPRGPPRRGGQLPGEPNFDHLKPPDDSMFL